jgi:hypothetical protein
VSRRSRQETPANVFYSLAAVGEIDRSPATLCPDSWRGAPINAWLSQAPLRGGGRGEFRSSTEGSSGQRLVTTGEGALQAYQQQDSSRAHRLDVRFEPPLPSVEHLAGEVSSHFTVSLDGFANLISGEVIVDHDDLAATLHWRFDAPAWTRAWGLLTTAALGDDAVTHIELKSIPPK